MSKHKIFVYGTLRPGTNTELHTIKGAMFDLGAYPGVILDTDDTSATFVAETIEVDDVGLMRLDGYEGYSEESPETSLYIRQRYNDGWIYVFNQDVFGYPRVEGGDWLVHEGEQRGRAAGYGG